MPTIIGAFFVGQQNWPQIFKGKTYLAVYGDPAVFLHFGSITYVEVVFSICDCLNGPMVIANLIAPLGSHWGTAKKRQVYNAGGTALDTTLLPCRKFPQPLPCSGKTPRRYAAEFCRRGQHVGGPRFVHGTSG